MYPATGALMLAGEPSCSGTLIAPDVVLTAGHCVDPLVLSGRIPGFSLVEDANNASSSEIVSGETTHKHSEFNIVGDPPPGLGQTYDIGLLILAQPITSVDYEILPGRFEASTALASGMSVEIVGYGMTDADSIDFGVKHHGVADLVEVGDYELLIGKTGQQQNCKGDSGGPGFIQIAGKRRLVGVVSRSPDTVITCDHGGIDTRVDSYLDWIHSHAEIPCGSGKSEPCAEPDAGASVGADAGGTAGGADAGARTEPEQPGGCQVGSGTTPWALALLLLTLLLRRRRRQSD